jgi:hypothetical protein
MSLQYIQKDRILHIIYSKIEQLPSHILDIANSYEGYISQRIGFNFPLIFVKKHFPKSKLLTYSIDYIIVYKKGDIQTKKHELQHAKYYLDSSFRDEVQTLWNSFSESYQQSILQLLQKMKYPPQLPILLDEFQAYYFTEKSNFFGKPS